MSTKNVITAAVVALATSLLAFAVFSMSTTDVQKNSLLSAAVETFGDIKGVVLESPYVFKAGHGDGGNFLAISADGEINAGANQAAWRNTTGRTVYVLPENVSIGYTTGTASSTWTLYVGTSTSATFTNYARPTPTNLLMDGASIATSTIATGGISVARVGTTTSAGFGFAVPPLGYVVFDVQEAYACKSIGLCETATSTNRGVTKFFWTLRGHYKP